MAFILRVVMTKPAFCKRLSFMSHENQRAATRTSRRNLTYSLRTLQRATAMFEEAARQGSNADLMRALSVWEKALAETQDAKNTCLGLLSEEVEAWIDE
jgi:hypothetical protein